MEVTEMEYKKQTITQRFMGKALRIFAPLM